MVRTRQARWQFSPGRWLRLLWLRTTRALSLLQRFLLVALLVVALGMVVLGSVVATYVQRGITEGVAATAAASIESLILHHVPAFGSSDLTQAERSELDAIFAIGNDTSSTRLLEIRIRNLDGDVLYQSASELLEEAGDEEDALLERATTGMQSRVVSVDVDPVGDIATYPIELLEIYAPLRHPDSGDVFAIAELYYSARAVLQQRDRAQLEVWLLVGVAGVLMIGALYLLVHYVSGTIARQRARLARNLADSRRLNEENRALSVASDELRQNANFANESLLAQVGSDIHDGPIQMLTLVILRLSKDPATAKLASEAMEELRNISNGLVLPELADLTLEETLRLAVERHEQLTGLRIEASYGALPDEASMVVKICAFRVLQEALTNAFRHGAHDGQCVEAGESGGNLLLSVRNQVRRNAELGPEREGLGLRGMRYRVESLGGTLLTRLNEGEESLVSALIPLRRTS